jgi:hypothetical protein
MSAWEALPGVSTNSCGCRSVEDVFLDEVEGAFLGMQCDTGLQIGPEGPVDPDPDVERTQMGYPFDFIEHALRAVGACLRDALDVRGYLY